MKRTVFRLTAALLLLVVCIAFTSCGLFKKDKDAGNADKDTPVDVTPSDSGKEDTPGTPDSPDQPDTPKPDDPDQPENPDNPDQPEDPDNPETPDNPENPDDPGTPIPDQPDTPPESSETGCTHDWNDGVGTDATCTAAGQKVYTCRLCGATRTQVIPAKGHTSVYDPQVDSTCTTEGLTAGAHCSVCGVVLTAQTAIPARGHSFGVGEVTTPPTCTATGVRTYTCAACGIATKTEAVPATGHRAVDWTVTTSPTCLTEGVKSATCLECGTAFNAAVPKTGHTFEKTDGLCTVCGASAGLTFVSNGDGTCTVTGATSEKMIYLNIPAVSPSGDSVTAIAAEAFKGTDLQVVVIPSGVTSIGKDAFWALPLGWVLYQGTEAQFNAIAMDEGNEDLEMYLCLYTDSASVGQGGEGAFWHYVNDIPTVWDSTGGGDGFGPLHPTQ